MCVCFVVVFCSGVSNSSKFTLTLTTAITGGVGDSGVRWGEVGLGMHGGMGWGGGGGGMGLDEIGLVGVG